MRSKLAPGRNSYVVTRSASLMMHTVRRPLAPPRAVDIEAIDMSALAGIVGYLSGAGFFTLWFIEQKSRANFGV